MTLPLIGKIIPAAEMERRTRFVNEQRALADAKTRLINVCVRIRTHRRAGRHLRIPALLDEMESILRQIESLEK